VILKEKIVAEFDTFASSTNILEIDMDTQSSYAMARGIRQNTTVALYNKEGVKVDQKFDPEVEWIRDFFTKNPLN
jgi:hypothetical protein